MHGFDGHMLLSIMLAAVVGGLIGLDRTALGQFMVSQPIVAGPLTGWVLGDPVAGLIIGGTLELIWVLDMPVGTFVPADSTVATVAATAIVVLGSGGAADPSVVGFGLLLTVLMAPASRLADQLMRQRNAQIPELALSPAGLPTEGRVAFWHIAGLLVFFLKSFIQCLVMIPAGIAAVSLFLRAPEALHRAMNLYVHVLPLLGIASAAGKLATSALDRRLVIGFLIGAVLVTALRLPVGIGVALAAVAAWFEGRSHAA